MANGWLRRTVRHIGQRAIVACRKGGSPTQQVPPFVAVTSTFVGVVATHQPLRWGNVPATRLWLELVKPASLLAPGDLTQQHPSGPRTGRDKVVDALEAVSPPPRSARFS